MVRDRGAQGWQVPAGPPGIRALVGGPRPPRPSIRTQGRGRAGQTLRRPELHHGVFPSRALGAGLLSTGPSALRNQMTPSSSSSTSSSSSSSSSSLANSFPAALFGPCSLSPPRLVEAGPGTAGPPPRTRESRSRQRLAGEGAQGLCTEVAGGAAHGAYRSLCPLSAPGPGPSPLSGRASQAALPASAHLGPTHGPQRPFCVARCHRGRFEQTSTSCVQAGHPGLTSEGACVAYCNYKTHINA